VKDRPKSFLAVLGVFSLLFLFSSCGEKTEEQVILEFVEELARSAEKREAERIMSHLADDYSDFEGRGDKETREMLEGYFHQYRGIVIHVLGIRMEDLTHQEASLHTDVAFSSGAAQVFRKFVKASTQNYRIHVKLTKKEDQWVVQYAEWRYVTLQELFPESLPLLEKIFPEL
jgi:ketosteroid isomerase-like protein